MLRVGEAQDVLSMVQLPRAKDGKSCLSFIHIPKTAGGAVEGASLEAHGREAKPDSVCWGNSTNESPMWGRCDVNVWKCTNYSGGTRQKRGPLCLLPDNMPTSTPETIRNLALKDGCSPWHLPPAFEPSLARYYSEQCDSFCIVRDPMQRLISHMRMYHNLQVCDQKKLESLTRSLLNKLDLKDDCHGVPQVYYVFRDGNPNAQRICGNVLKYEELNQSFPRLMETYGISQVKSLPKLHENMGHCTVRPTPATISMVREFYARDYEAFGYEIPTNSTVIPL
ncbi:unnamed protein product [Symbiodinium sp. CCMP2456]|nr:unnamed protein product [Symbiodinium sp. CCMP2456]